MPFAIKIFYGVKKCRFHANLRGGHFRFNEEIPAHARRPFLAQIDVARRLANAHIVAVDHDAVFGRGLATLLLSHARLAAFCEAEDDVDELDDGAGTTGQDFGTTTLAEADAEQSQVCGDCRDSEKNSQQDEAGKEGTLYPTVIIHSVFRDSSDGYQIQNEFQWSALLRARSGSRV
jgi:hypothetical protein